MEWKQLSSQSQDIIEWIENPVTDKKEIVVIERNKFWFKRCIAFGGDVEIFCEDKVFDEIKEWVINDSKIKIIEVDENKLVFTSV